MKKCETCNRNLIAFQGHYLHPDTVCNGLKDHLRIDAIIEDEFMYEKFIDKYGKPTMDDSDVLHKITSNPFFYILLKLFRFI